MTAADQPYTDDDLRAEAARQHAALTENPDFVGVGEQMKDSEVQSMLPPEEADGAEGIHWGELLDPKRDDCEAYDLAQNLIYDLMRGAADVSRWAVDLGADNLWPSDSSITVNGDGKPIARIHFALEPRAPREMEASLVEGIGSVLAALTPQARQEALTSEQTVEILRINGDGEHTRNEHGHKTVAVPVEVSGLGDVTLLLTPDVASALYTAVCEE